MAKETAEQAVGNEYDERVRTKVNAIFMMVNAAGQSSRSTQNCCIAVVVPFDMLVPRHSSFRVRDQQCPWLCQTGQGRWQRQYTPPPVSVGASIRTSLTIPLTPHSVISSPRTPPSILSSQCMAKGGAAPVGAALLRFDWSKLSSLTCLSERRWQVS